MEDAHEKRERSESFFSAGEKKDILELFARGRGDNLDARFVGILGVGEPHEGLTTPEQFGEGDGEIFIDEFEGFVELDSGDVVYFLDRRLGVLNGVEEILTLGFEEGVSLGGLGVFV